MRSESDEARERFARIYEGNPPWEIGKPQEPFVSASEQFVSPILECGCGTGNAAIFFARRGLQITAIDFVESTIERARAKAEDQGVAVEFLVKDAMTLASWDRRFATVVDSGLFHVYDGEERRRYVEGLSHVTEYGGRLYLLGFSPSERAPGGGIAIEELCSAFERCWTIESYRLVQGELNPAFVRECPEAFPEGAPTMFFTVLRRDEPCSVAVL